MKKLVGFAIGLAAVAFLSGCSSMPLNYVPASKPIEQGKYTPVGKEVEGIDTQISVLGFGASLPGSAQRRALKDALSRAPGADALVEMAVDFEIVNFVWAQIKTTRVTGTPVKTNNVTR